MGRRGGPEISFVLATHNRRSEMERTLARILRCGVERDRFEVIVVDNGSTDGTPEAMVGRVDTLIRLRRNLGSCAKAKGVEHARGEFVVFLDDDSSPRPGAVERMLDRFKEEPSLAAAGFAVHLPNGTQECSALPGIFVGCGVGLRSAALRQCGGLDPGFFMQAEEYDLCFRLATCGWTVAVYDELGVEHLKSPQARRSERTTYYDVRNNLRVIARYLPREAAHVYREDCIQRYAWLAEHDGHVEAFERGRRVGGRYAAWERWRYRSWRLPEAAFERFFGWAAIRRRMSSLVASGVRKILLADLGKNVYPFHRAAALAGAEVVAIADDRFAVPGRAYRGVPIVPVADAIRLPFDAIVVSNCAAWFAARTADRIEPMSDRPIHAWFAPTAQDGTSARSVQRTMPIAADEGHRLTNIGPAATAMSYRRRAEV